MATFISHPVTVQLDVPAGPFTRADLQFDGVDHSRASYEARVFLNNTDVDPSTPMEPARGYAGSFFVFGHGGCAGDVGHCDVPTGPARPFDLRPEHQLTKITERLIATEPLRRVAGQHVSVSIVPVIDPEDASDLPDALVHDVLHFDRIKIVTYQ